MIGLMMIKVLLMAMAAIAMLIFGILICVKKKKDGLFLGLWLILSAVSIFVSSSQTVIMRSSVPIDKIGQFLSATNIVVSLLMTAQIIVLFLHAKVCYGSKGIVLVSILAVLADLIPRTCTIFLFKIGSDSVAVSYLSRFISEMFIIACLVIIMVAYIRGRYKDNLSLTRFRIPLFLLIFSILFLGVDSIALSSAVEGTMNMDTTDGLFYFLDLLPVIFKVVAGIVILAKKSRKKLPEVVMVSEEG